MAGIKKIFVRLSLSVLLCLLSVVGVAGTIDTSGDMPFSLALYQQLPQDQQNTVVSPFSLRDCLALAYLGSDKATQAAMNKVLNYGDPALLVTSLNQRNKALASAVGDSNTLTSTNSLWVDQSTSFLKAYDSTIGSLSNAGTYQVDYSHSPDRAVEEINDWASKNTEGMIENILSSGDINPNTKLVLVNALYFKGIWGSPFDEHGTEKVPFYEDKDHQPSILMMQQHNHIRYHETDQYQMIDLPYKDSSVSMLVLLPKDRDQNLTELLDQIGDIQTIQASMDKVDTKVYLPKFKITSSWNELLSTMTQMMGVSEILLDKLVSDGPLKVALIVQQAVIEVDEVGTKAAAVTGVMIASTMSRPLPPKVFNADHPFIFLIYDHKTNNILFMGQMVKAPSESDHITT